MEEGGGEIGIWTDGSDEGDSVSVVRGFFPRLVAGW